MIGSLIVFAAVVVVGVLILSRLPARGAGGGGAAAAAPAALAGGAPAGAGAAAPAAPAAPAGAGAAPAAPAGGAGARLWAKVKSKPFAWTIVAVALVVLLYFMSGVKGSGFNPADWLPSTAFGWSALLVAALAIAGLLGKGGWMTKAVLGLVAALAVGVVIFNLGFEKDAEKVASHVREGAVKAITEKKEEEKPQQKAASQTTFVWRNLNADGTIPINEWSVPYQGTPGWTFDLPPIDGCQSGKWRGQYRLSPGDWQEFQCGTNPSFHFFRILVVHPGYTQDDFRIHDLRPSR